MQDFRQNVKVFMTLKHMKNNDRYTTNLLPVEQTKNVEKIQTLKYTEEDWLNHRKLWMTEWMIKLDQNMTSEERAEIKQGKSN